MPAFLIGLALKLGIPARLAKIAVIMALVALLVVGLGVGKCASDRSVIRSHDAKREAQIAKADRQADAKAAEQRRADDARITTETQEIKEAVREAESTGADPRAAYYACLARMQDARARNQPPPAC